MPRLSKSSLDALQAVQLRLEPPLQLLLASRCLPLRLHDESLLLRALCLQQLLLRLQSRGRHLQGLGKGRLGCLPPCPLRKQLLPESLRSHRLCELL